MSKDKQPKQPPKQEERTDSRGCCYKWYKQWWDEQQGRTGKRAK